VHCVRGGVTRGTQLCHSVIYLLARVTLASK